MLELKNYVEFIVRVSDDEHHAIYVQDFDDLEEEIVERCLDHIDEDVIFSIRFMSVREDYDG